MIQSHTNIRSDGKVESYCGLKIRETSTQKRGKHKHMYIFIQQILDSPMLKNLNICAETSTIPEKRKNVKQKGAVSFSNMPKKALRGY